MSGERLVWICWLFWLDAVLSQYSDGLRSFYHNKPVILDYPAALKPQQAGIHVPGRLSPFVGKSLSPRRGIALVVGAAVEEKLSELNELRKEARELMGSRRRISLRSRIRIANNSVPGSKQRTIELVHYQHDPQIQDSKLLSIHHPGISQQGIQVLHSGFPQQTFRVEHSDLPHQNVQLGIPQLISEEAASRIIRPHLSNIQSIGPSGEPNLLMGRVSSNDGSDRVSLRSEQVARILQQMRQRTRLSVTTMTPLRMPSDIMNRGLNGILESIENLANLNKVPMTRNYRDVNVARSYEGRRRSNADHSKNNVGYGDLSSKYDTNMNSKYDIKSKYGTNSKNDMNSKYDINSKYDMNSKYGSRRDISSYAGGDMNVNFNNGNAIPMDVSTREIRYKQQRLPQRGDSKFNMVQRMEFQQLGKSDYDFQSRNAHTSNQDHNRQHKQIQPVHERYRPKQPRSSVREDPQYPQWMKEYEQHQRRLYPRKSPGRRRQSLRAEQYELQQAYSPKSSRKDRQQYSKETYEVLPTGQYQRRGQYGGKESISQRRPYNYNTHGTDRQRLRMQHSRESSTHSERYNNGYQASDRHRSQGTRNSYMRESLPSSQQQQQSRHRLDKSLGRESTYPRHRIQNLNNAGVYERTRRRYTGQRQEQHGRRQSRRQNIRETLNREHRRYPQQSRKQSGYQTEDKYSINGPTRRYQSEELSRRKQPMKRNNYSRLQRPYSRKSPARQRHYSQKSLNQQQLRRPYSRQGQNKSWKHDQRETQRQYQKKSYIKKRRPYSQEPRRRHQFRRTYDQRPKGYSRKDVFRGDRQDPPRTYDKRNRYDKHQNYVDKGYREQRYTPLRYPQSQPDVNKRELKLHYPQQTITRKTKIYNSMNKTSVMLQKNTHRDIVVGRSKQNQLSKYTLNDAIGREKQRLTSQKKIIQLNQTDLPQQNDSMQNAKTDSRKFKKQYIQTRFARNVKISQQGYIPTQQMTMVSFPQRNTAQAQYQSSVNKPEQKYKELPLEGKQHKRFRPLRQKQQQQHPERTRAHLNKKLQHPQEISGDQSQQMKQNPLPLQRYPLIRQPRTESVPPLSLHQRRQLQLLRRQIKTLTEGNHRNRLATRRKSSDNRAVYNIGRLFPEYNVFQKVLVQGRNTQQWLRRLNKNLSLNTKDVLLNNSIWSKILQIKATLQKSAYFMISNRIFFILPNKKNA